MFTIWPYYIFLALIFVINWSISDEKQGGVQFGSVVFQPTLLVGQAAIELTCETKSFAEISSKPIIFLPIVFSIAA